MLQRKGVMKFKPDTMKKSIISKATERDVREM